MGYVVFGVSSSYLFEVLEILRRLAQPISAFVTNIAEGEIPEGIAPLVSVEGPPFEWRSPHGRHRPGGRPIVKSSERLIPVFAPVVLTRMRT